jgi:molecular chaperone HtpG
MSEPGETPNTFPFRAEVKQLLYILAHSLYKERDIFLRELISNASDALTRMHFEMLTNRDVLDPDAELAIHIEIPETNSDAPKELVIKDTGIGMTRAEMEQNLGTIAQSGAREFISKIGAGQLDPSDVIGQFGVGFYSVFMVADKVQVISRSYLLDAVPAMWESDGGELFRIEAADKRDRGTEIHITLKKDAEEFAQAWKLRQLVKKHSDFVRFPIYIGTERANQQTSLWRKSPGEVTGEDYQHFYQQLTLDFDEPLATIHFSSDAPVNVRALLFIPAHRDKNLLAARREPGLQLYSHNVLIQEYCTDLLPRWLNFIDGVVDSEDLPLNVSRETVQNNRIMQQLSRTLRARVLRELRTISENDADKYDKFWNEFGRTFREAIATDPEARTEVLPLFRYASSRSDGKLISLDDYIKGMQEGQDAIYFVLGDDLKSVAHSPHLDPFRARNIEVLYRVDPLDALIAPLVTEYQGKKLRNIDDAELELPEQAEPDAAPSEATTPEYDFNVLLSRITQLLGDRVADVRASRVLKDSPLRLVSPKDDHERERGRLSRYFDKEYKVPKKIVEVNRNHPLIADLARALREDPDSELAELTIEQLYDSALAQEGLHPNPAEMLPRIQKLLALAVKKG